MQGQPVSNGLVVGRIAKTVRQTSGPHTPLVIHSPDAEWQKYAEAQKKALAQLEELKKDAGELKKTGSSGLDSDERDRSAFPEVMTSYSYVLNDELLTERIKTSLYNDSIDAASAILQAFKDVRAVVSSMEDVYLRDKVLDLDACEELLLSALSDAKSLQSNQWSHLKGRIVVINHPSPQDIIRFHQVGVAGIIAEHGSDLSHAAILARSFNIPTIFSADGIIRGTRNGQLVILDAHEGKISLQPGRGELRKAEARRAVELMLQHKLKAGAQAIARTVDGHRIVVFANADGPIDSRAIVNSGAEGIGLFRTEFLHLSAEEKHSIQPGADSQEQLSVFFRLTAESIAPRWATFRLLDAGGDKPFPAKSTSKLVEKSAHMQGPFGLRGVRFLLAERDILELQLNALIHANTSGNIRILIPYVTDLIEIRRIKAMIHDIWSKIPDAEKAALHYPSLGVMIETPAAVQMLDQFAAECDFISIGSNDLTQHYLCVERENPLLSEMFSSFHPAILRCLKSIFDQQKNIDIVISLCGELASDPTATELLLGLGCHQLSCRTAAIPVIKEIIRKTDIDEAKKFAETLLRVGSAEEIQRIVKQRYEEKHGRLSVVGSPRNRAS